MPQTERPLQDPARQMRGFRPMKAFGHFRKLVANKEDTEQVFHITNALKGHKTTRQAREFIRSEAGQRFLKDGTDIPAMLDDHARWADCAPGSVGRRYVEFMQAEGLTAAGLVAESHRWLPKKDRPNDLYEWYFDRLRDTHDLYHVLTGYGRDALGELCLLGFTYKQNHNPGVAFISYLGMRQLKKETGTRAPVMAALREGRALGAAAAKLSHVDVAALMREPLADARARLGIGKPELYRECLQSLKGAGINQAEVLVQ